MKDLYEWLQSEVIEAQDLLENEIIKDDADEIVFSSSKAFLNQSKELLANLIELLSEKDLDVMKLIALISKLKCEGTDKDEDEVTQSMIFKMMKISALDKK